MSELEIPLFPLSTVLFPGGEMQLRIFEPRYSDLVSRSIGLNQPFGIILIERGRESGRVDTHQIGTLATIEDWFQSLDGLLGVSVVGGRRFRLYSTHRQSDGLYVGRAMLLRRETPVPIEPRYNHLVRMLKAVVSEMDATEVPSNIDYSNATSVGMRLADLLPLDADAKQMCLEFNDPVERLDYLSPLIEALRNRAPQKAVGEE